MSDRDQRPAARMQPRLAEMIAAELREEILNGVHTRSGMLPRQEDLISRFGVSAPPLREALRILEVEGLITVRRGKVGGAVVHKPDGAMVSQAIGMALQAEQVALRDLAESLREWEPACAAACAGDTDHLDELAPFVEANLELTEAAIGDGPMFTYRSRQFHDLIVARTPNSTTRLIVRSMVALWSAQEQTWAREASESGHYPTAAEQRTVLDAHRRIGERIIAGDVAAAERGARSHLVASQELILGAFGDRSVDASSARAVRGLRDDIARRSDGNDLIADLAAFRDRRDRAV
ncbi:FadR/GntR family transcriptional regulator [Pseudonocardia endophytica]|uniref:GntR family transcriptional regulator n=1 Tax=Pseudonocardia endophytica TaxID=401976 RepID=A0A4R1HQE4_PSEEN|nr:GntR family transcriptional regulator [Pseudonocardia endophytica]TCK21979.1 GntR family transcriptional regulator [Pseudonocardia endophytica]